MEEKYAKKLMQVMQPAGITFSCVGSTVSEIRNVKSWKKVKTIGKVPTTL